MTTLSRSYSARALRVVGTLFVVAGVAAVVGLALSQYAATLADASEANSAMQVPVQLSYLAMLAELLVLAAAFVLLYVLLPRTLFSWIFLLAAAGNVIDAARDVVPGGALYGIAIALFGTLGAAIYVVARRLFTPIPSVIFLVTAIVGLVAIVVALLFVTQPAVADTVLYLSYALYIASGIAMILASRAKTTTTATR